MDDFVPSEEIEDRMGATLRGRYGTVDQWRPGPYVVDAHPDGLFGFRCNIPTCRIYRAPFETEEAAEREAVSHARTHVEERTP